jgi:DNA modification methylase
MNYNILLGDCRATLANIATGSVQTVVTSPPYWNLRDYGTPGQIGLEALPDCLAWARQEPPCGACFVCEMRSVFGAELRRVLSDDGTVWVNLGDSYAHSTKNNDSFRRGRDKIGSGKMSSCGLPIRSLIGIPWRVALALQADGWILRQDIIWHKPNPMPESMDSRCTKAHEYIFLLAKQPRYYFDAKAIQEPTTGTAHRRASVAAIAARTVGTSTPPKASKAGFGVKANASFHAATADLVENRNKRSVWTVATQPYAGAHFATFPPELIRPCVLAGSRPGDLVPDCFNGSGTTGLVSLEEGRRYVGCELNPAYIDLTQRRLAGLQSRLQFVAPSALPAPACSGDCVTCIPNDTHCLPCRWQPSPRATGP